MHSRLPLPFFLLGLALLYLGERSLADTPRWAADAAAAALLLASLLASAWRATTARQERRQAHLWLLATYALCVSALAVYATARWGGFWFSAKTLPLLQVAWPALLLLGLLPTVAMEQAIQTMALTPKLELWRVRLAARSAVVVALSFITFAGVNYAANAYNRKIDLSYFKTARVGSATHAIVKDLTQPVEFILFFPPGNDVLEQTRGYLDELCKSNPEVLKVITTDQALEPERARKLRVRANGSLAVVAGSRSELLRLDLDSEDARGTLRNLDGEIQQRLLKVIRPPRVAYLTTGHNERDSAPGKNDKRAGLADFKNILEMQGYTVRRLGLAEGLGREVPGDATLVIIMGPLEDFAAPERYAIHQYLEHGGRVLAAMDPDHGVTDDALLAPMGVQVSRALMASERFLVRVEGHGESPYDLVTNRASSHPIVSTLEQNPGRMGVVLLGAGAVRRAPAAPPELNVTFALHSMANTWEDKNGNGRFDRGSEVQENLEFAAAVEKKLPANSGPTKATGDANQLAHGAAGERPPMRAVVVGDADFATDGVSRNPGNAYFLVDILRWLGGDEKDIGVTESEMDVPILHRKDDDAVWFYGTSFIIPAAILFGGIASTRRRGRVRRKSDG